jgi:hypothetical protein
VTHRRLDGLALLQRELEGPQPVAAGLAKHVGVRAATH